MDTKTLLCVGSGLTPRYRLNTLQGLALPPGSHLQFRYAEKIIQESIRDRLGKRELNGAAIVLGHVDCTKVQMREKDRCFIVPYRHAILLDCQRAGAIFVLNFELRAFAFAKDIEAFQTKLGANTPHWTTDSQPVGDWCQTLDSDTVPETNSYDEWQAIARQLAAREDFRRQPYFLRAQGVYEKPNAAKAEVELSLKYGQYRLRPNQEYVLRLFHFDPKGTDHAGTSPTQWLRAETSSALLKLNQDPLLAIDSPYDLKPMQFRTGDTNRDSNELLWVHPEKTSPPPSSDNPTDSRLVPDLYFPILLKSDSWALIGKALVLGCLLGAAQLITVFSKGAIEHAEVITLLVVGLSFLTAFFVVLGLRKPL